jgi:hypothetical protein
MERPEPVEAAQALVAERFPEAVAAFVTGSVVTPMRTETSDLDIVVVRAEGSKVYRESLMYQGWPVELFVHTRESLRWFREREGRERVATLDRMVATGIAVAGAKEACDELQHDSREYVAAGPQVKSDLDFKRYVITDLIDDFVGSQNDAETLMIAQSLYRAILELVLLANNEWSAGGKWLVRAVDQIEQGLTLEISQAMRHLVAADDRQPLIDAADRVLSPYGGRYWAGYYSEAKLD